MKKWMRRWRQQSKLEKMEKWREKGQAAVHCPIFLLNFPAVLAATFLLHVCLLSFISFPHKPLRLSLLLHFSKIFPCPEGFLLPNFLYFIIPSIELCCIPFCIIFSISLSFTGSSPSSFLLHCFIFKPCFDISPCSCVFSTCPLILPEIARFSIQTAYLTFPQNQPLSIPSPTRKFMYYSRQSTWTALTLKMRRKCFPETTVLEVRLILCNIPEDYTTVLAWLLADNCLESKDA